MLSNTDIRITPESYAAIDDEIDYFPVYAYDYETELNDAKKNIVLIDSTLKHDILSQLKSLMNGWITNTSWSTQKNECGFD